MYLQHRAKQSKKRTKVAGGIKQNNEGGVDVALAEEVSRKLTSLPRVLAPQCYFQTPFLLPPPMEYFSLFSPNLILWLAIMTTALYYHNSVSFHKVTSKHLYPEANLNFPYIVHSHRSHKTGEKTHIYINTYTHAHTHTDFLDPLALTS